MAHNGPNMPSPHSLSPSVHMEKGNAGLASQLLLHKRLWVSLLYYEGMLDSAGRYRSIPARILWARLSRTVTAG